MIIRNLTNKSIIYMINNVLAHFQGDFQGGRRNANTLLLPSLRLSCGER